MNNVFMFWLWIMKVLDPTKTLHTLNAEVVQITEWGRGVGSIHLEQRVPKQYLISTNSVLFRRVLFFLNDHVGFWKILPLCLGVLFFQQTYIIKEKRVPL